MNRYGAVLCVFVEFLRLGLTSFGGPVAHIGYFRDAFVRRLRWLDEPDFADLVALCQFLPGPASSQLGMAIGLRKAGILGSGAAFLAFTFPSAALMALLAIGLAGAARPLDHGLFAGLAIAAVAVVAEAVRAMAVSLAAGRFKAAIALIAAAVCLALPGGAVQIGVLAIGGLIGIGFLGDVAPAAGSDHPAGFSRTGGAVMLTLFAALLVGLPLVAQATGSPAIGLFSAFYRAGALVFGGGHVVLPLLKDATVSTGLVPDAAFVAGYGAVQAMPGPLFSFASFLGAAAVPQHPALAAILATLALFAPAFLLIVGVLPFWHDLRRLQVARRALAGVNAAVVGLLGAALYDPVLVTAIHDREDMALAVLCYALLVAGRIPAWAVVIFAAASGWWLGL